MKDLSDEFFKSDPLYYFAVFGLPIIGVIGLIWLLTDIRKTFSSEAVIWIGFFAIAVLLLIWVIISSTRFQATLTQLDRLREKLQQRLKNYDRAEPLHTSTQSVGEQFENLAYVDSQSSDIQFFPRALNLDSRYALERLPAPLQVGVQHIPALLTALGIFFTFVGLIIGIGEIDLQGSADGLMEGMTTLLGGVGLAFYSSLGGIALSFLVLIATRVQISRADSITGEISQLASRLEFKQKQDPARVLRDLRNNARNTANTLHEVKDNTADVSSGVNRLATEIATELSGVLREAMDKAIGEPLVEMNEQMLEFQQKGLETHEKTLGNVLDTFLEEFQQSMGEQFANLDSTLEKTLEWHAETQQLLDSLLDEMREERKKQALLLAKRRQFAEEHHERQTEAHKTQQKAMRTLFENTREFHDERLDQEQQAQQEHIEQQRKLFDTQRQFREEQSQAHQEALRSLFEDAAQFHTERLDDERDLHTDRMEQQRALLDDRRQFYEQQSEAHQKTLDALAETADDINASMGTLEESQKELTSLLNSSIELSDKLGEKLSTTIDDQYAQLEKLQDTLQRMERVSEELPREYKAVLEQIQDELRTGLSETFQMFDQSTAEIVKRLSGSYVRMEGTLQTLSDELERIPELPTTQGRPTGEPANGKTTTQPASTVSD